MTVVIGAIYGAPSEGEMDLLANFESPSSLGPWEFYNVAEFPGAKGTFRRLTAAARTGKYGAALSFDFRGGGNYVQASIALPTERPVTAVRLWVRKPSGTRLAVRAVDSDGQTFQKQLNFGYEGWQEVRIRLSGWTFSWGGKNDGVFRGPPTRFALLAENTAAKKSGVVYLDDLRIEFGGDTMVNDRVEYTVTRFLDDPAWSGGSGSPNRLALDPAVSGASAIHNDVALMGRPLALSLKVKSSARGPRLRLTLSSHFQRFEKLLPPLDRGQQVITTELGDMKSWQHAGGENDGVVRFPLRVVRIGLEPGDGPDRPVVELQALRCATGIAAREQVVLVPQVRRSEDSVRFVCKMQNLLPEKIPGILHSMVRRFSGEVVAERRSEMTVPADGRYDAEVSIPAQDGFLECVFRFDAGGHTFGPVSITSAAPRSDPGDSTLAPESPFGMGLYLYRYPNTPDGFRQMEQAASRAQAAGVKWSREEFLWHRIEPEQGKFHFDYYDRVVDTARRHGISIYGLIDYWSPWTEPYTEKGIQDYVNYCRALVRHYKDRIKHWEIWNEPNIFFWSGPREMYPELLRRAYRAIKEEDPDAAVLGCSTAGIDRAFVSMVMKADAPFDILTIHPYRARLDDRQFITELRQVQELITSENGKARPVWITEMGWPTQVNGGITERQQAGLLSRVYLCSVASGAVGNVSWYDFREDGENPFYNEHHFGVLRRRDLAAKAAYQALTTVCRTLAGQTVVEELSLGDHLLGFRFAGAGRETVAVWAPTTDVVAALRFDPTPDQAWDLMGDPLPILKTKQSSLVALSAGFPVFFTGEHAKLVACEAAVTLSSPKAWHPGDRATITVSIDPDRVGRGVRPSLQPPAGWAVRSESDEATGVTRFHLTAPRDAFPADYPATLELRAGDAALHLPLILTVEPKLAAV